MIGKFTQCEDSANIVKSKDEDLKGSGWPLNGKVQF
jgi:hypothetical protein